jgi:integrase/recombinase XerD
MNQPLRYRYESVFAPYIEGLVQQKKADGFIYELEAYILKLFDRFCIDNGYDKQIISREMSMEWAIQRKTEGINYRNQRVSFVRQLSLYMNSMGIASYIPRFMPSATVTVPHIPDRDELTAFFEVIDTYLPSDPQWHRLSMEYQGLFRMYYCCGMRLAEGCGLKKKDVDLENGIITVRQSKGRKDRLVYMADDFTLLCRKYSQRMESVFPCTAWFFPGLNPQMHILKTSIDRKFKQLWRMTPYAGRCDKETTVHALRHAFVVNRMNQWMDDGIPLEVMMPYLSRYLGHSGIEGTMYYYHQVKDAFRVVRQKDQVSKKVIPEVTPYEE